MNQRKLVRSRTNMMIGGVCGGLGEYLSIDPTFVRLFFALLAFGQGVGFLLYFVLWLVVPAEDAVEGGTIEDRVQAGAQEITDRAKTMGEDISKGTFSSGSQAGLIIGGALIILGVFFLIDNLNIPWLSGLRFNVLWPILIVGAGIFLLIRRPPAE